MSGGASGDTDGGAYAGDMEYPPPDLQQWPGHMPFMGGMPPPMMGAPPYGAPWASPMGGFPGMPPGPMEQPPPKFEEMSEEELNNWAAKYESQGKYHEDIAQRAQEKADACRAKARDDPSQGAPVGFGQPFAGFPYPGYAAGNPYPPFQGGHNWGTGSPPPHPNPKQKPAPKEAPEKPGKKVKPAETPASELPPEVPDNEKTTVMLKNIPNDYKRGHVKEMLDGAGFVGKYDFLYVPRDFQRKAGLGYAFVNLAGNAVALELRSKFEGYNSWTMQSSKVCETAWGHPHQGLQAHVDRYRDSPLMHPEVHEDFKPMLFDEKGAELKWPEPTKKIRKPRMKSGARQEGEEGAAEDGNQEAGAPAEGQ